MNASSEPYRMAVVLGEDARFLRPVAGSNRELSGGLAPELLVSATACARLRDLRGCCVFTLTGWWQMEKFQKYAVGDRLFIWYATSGSGKPFWWSTGVREYQIEPSAPRDEP